MSESFLSVRELRKSYGHFSALDGVSFTVGAGELFGLLGPNGAGKTTLLSVLSCLTEADGGEAQLGGTRLTNRQSDIRHKIGLATQDLAIYPELTARENLHFFGTLYGLKGASLQTRAKEILERIALTDKADQRTSTFSGGMKRRLNLGVAIMHQPEILYLDEPTTGVDPQSRNHIFEHVRELNRQGMTILYTSHYMEEVQTLCPRLAILDHGRVIACDTLDSLINQYPTRITLVGHGPTLATAWEEQLPTNLHVRPDQIEFTSHTPGRDLVETLARMNSRGYHVSDVHMKAPTLEDVFLALTKAAVRDN